MNQYLRNLNRLEFMVTNACTGKCKHCSQGEHADCKEHIPCDIARRVVQQVVGSYPITSVMTFGGEPLLFPETVYVIHSEAARLGVRFRQLITNGFFSKSRDKIAEVARKLALSEVNDILLSVDAFHQEYIPIELVMEFALAIKEQGIPIKTHPAWLVEKGHDNPYNQRTIALLEEFEKIGITSSSGNNIFIQGNARRYLSGYEELSRKNECPYVQNPEDICAICISGDGSVLGGNINDKEIIEIMDCYGKK